MQIKVVFNVLKGFLTYQLNKWRFSKVDYFNYEKLISYPEFILPSPLFFNISYGLFRAINKSYKGKVDMVHDYVEHGLFYSESATLLMNILHRKPIRKVFTFSDRRKKQIENVLSKSGYNGIEVIAIGPMINNAPNFYNRVKLDAIKKTLGKTLLVIPMHSWYGVNNNFAHDSFIEEIERIKIDFDTVLVCLYYLDIRKGKEQFYKDMGYTIVCNGNRCDPSFISRHRDLIELADLTMSNGIGTHIGYSIALNRPHYYYKQDMEVELAPQVKDDERIEQEYRSQFEKEVVELFGQYSLNITEEQKTFVRYYWGDY